MSDTVKILDDCLKIMNKPDDKVVILLKEMIRKKNKIKLIKLTKLKELEEELSELDDELFVLTERKKKMIENVNINELLEIFK